MSACEGRGHSNARTNSTDQTESNETDDTIQCIIWRECLVLVQTNDTTCKIFFIKKISDWRKLFASNQHNFHIFHQKYVSQRRFFYRNECMKQVSSKSHQKCQWLNVTKWTDKRSRIIIITSSSSSSYYYYYYMKLAHKFKQARVRGIGVARSGSWRVERE